MLMQVCTWFNYSPCDGWGNIMSADHLIKTIPESFLQTDAAINPGNSGGALVNMQGGLVGINTAIARPTGSYASYGFAVPSNIVSKVVSDLIEYGMVQRGYLGLMIRNVDGNLAREKGLHVNRGVYVDSVSVNSAAGYAGVKVGDVIVEINGNEVNTTSKLLEIVGRQYPGDRVNLKVNRDGREMNFTVILRNIDGKEKKFERSSQEILDKLGIELEAIDRPTKRRLQVDSGLRISRIYPGRVAKLNARWNLGSYLVVCESVWGFQKIINFVGVNNIKIRCE